MDNGYKATLTIANYAFHHSYWYWQWVVGGCWV